MAQRATPRACDHRQAGGSCACRKPRLRPSEPLIGPGAGHKHPTAEWVAQQVREAFPGDGSIPRFLQRDRDGAYGWAFRRAIRSMGMTEFVSAPPSPWQNAHVERVIGSIRRECTDHIIPMGEAHLLRIVRECVEYYNGSQPHQSLDGDAPIPRDVEAVGGLVAKPLLGGLHHRYSRVA